MKKNILLISCILITVFLCACGSSDAPDDIVGHVEEYQKVAGYLQRHFEDYGYIETNESGMKNILLHRLADEEEIEDAVNIARERFTYAWFSDLACIFWNDETKTLGILCSDTPKKEIASMKDWYPTVRSKKITPNCYMVGNWKYALDRRDVSVADVNVDEILSEQKIIFIMSTKSYGEGIYSEGYFVDHEGYRHFYNLTEPFMNRLMDDTETEYQYLLEHFDDFPGEEFMSPEDLRTCVELLYQVDPEAEMVSDSEYATADAESNIIYGIRMDNGNTTFAVLIDDGPTLEILNDVYAQKIIEHFGSRWQDIPKDANVTYVANDDLSEQLKAEDGFEDVINEQDEKVPSGMEERYRSILLNGEEFVNIDIADHHRRLSLQNIREAVSGDDSIKAEVTKFSIVDLDENGEDELVLWIQVNEDSDYGYEILYCRDMEVYGFTLTYRQFLEPKADGTFLVSGGAANTRICKLQLSENGYSIEIVSDSGSTYDQDKKANIRWYDLTEANVNENL